MPLIVLLLALVAVPAQAQTWVGGYYCQDRAAEAELVRRVTSEMGIPQAAGHVQIYCTAHMPGPISGRSYQDIGLWTGTPCTTEYWTWIIGCINGAAQSVSTSGGWVVAFRAVPWGMDKYITIAQREGMSRGSRTWNEIRCMWTLDRLMRVLVHELHHVWFGYRHGSAMGAADRTMQDRVLARHGAWIRANEWPCQQPFVYSPQRPEYITSERITP